VVALDKEKYHGEAVVSGAVLAGQGLQLLLSGDYDGTAVTFERIP
jgi:hypothetical protein